MLGMPGLSWWSAILLAWVILMFPTFFILALFYSIALYLHLYRWCWGYPPSKERWYKEYQGYWDPPRRLIAQLWGWLAWIWHGHEIVGMEKVPSKNGPGGPAILVFYYPKFPTDYFHFFFACIREGKRSLSLVTENMALRFFVFGQMTDIFETTTKSSVESCVETLRSGRNLAVFPGGDYEMMMSDRSYQLFWKDRFDFAKVALEAKVPIIPVFTRNCQDVYRVPRTRNYGFFRTLHYLTRFSFVVPLYGGFPVKLITFVGDPIPYDPALTRLELTKKVKASMTELIQKYQPIPGNVKRALVERWRRPAFKDI